MVCQMHGESQTLVQVALNEAGKSLVPQITLGKQYNSNLNNYEIIFLYNQQTNQIGKEDLHQL